MKTETIEIIRKKLRDDLEEAKNTLLWNIELSSVDGVSPGVEEKVVAYRKAYKAMEDFEEWADEQEEDE